MLVIPLQSGSNGNCIYVEAGDTRLLFDAGISGVRAQRRLAEFGRDIRDIDAVIISHDHRDHIQCAGVYHRKFDLDVWMTQRTWNAAHRRVKLGKFRELRIFASGATLDFGDVAVETIRTPHDGVDGVGFVVSDGSRCIGVLTDLGHVFDGLGQLMAELDAVLIESNYDPHMLENGPYPWFLQQRISGVGGHLSNDEAAGLLRDAAGPKLRWACLGHLSEENNTPQIAMTTHRRVLGERFALHLASRCGAIGPLTL